jgi:hypothetical protein
MMPGLVEWLTASERFGFPSKLADGDQRASD